MRGRYRACRSVQPTATRYPYSDYPCPYSCYPCVYSEYPYPYSCRSRQPTTTRRSTERSALACPAASCLLLPNTPPHPTPPHPTAIGSRARLLVTYDFLSQWFEDCKDDIFGTGETRTFFDWAEARYMRAPTSASFGGVALQSSCAKQRALRSRRSTLRMRRLGARSFRRYTRTGRKSVRSCGPITPSGLHSCMPHPTGPCSSLLI